MTRWYRTYVGTVSDDKLAEAAVVACCTLSVAIAVWHSLLESAAATQDGGRFETTPRRVAATLHEPERAIQATFDAMSEIGMIEGDVITAWTRRQHESDSSTERSRKLRERRRNATATLQPVAATEGGRSATPPDTDTESETEEDTSKLASSSASQPGIDLEEAERRCQQAAGSDRLGSFAPIAELLLAGRVTLDDALVAIRARPAADGGIRSWKFYAKILADREAPAPAKAGPPQVFVTRGSAEWRDIVATGSHRDSLWTQDPATKAEGWWFDVPPSLSTGSPA